MLMSRSLYPVPDHIRQSGMDDILISAVQKSKCPGANRTFGRPKVHNQNTKGKSGNAAPARVKTRADKSGCPS